MDDFAIPSTIWHMGVACQSQAGFHMVSELSLLHDIHHGAIYIANDCTDISVFVVMGGVA